MRILYEMTGKVKSLALVETDYVAIKAAGKNHSKATLRFYDSVLHYVSFQEYSAAENLLREAAKTGLIDLTEYQVYKIEGEDDEYFDGGPLPF